jgi:hypothetical protein
MSLSIEDNTAQVTGSVKTKGSLALRFMLDAIDKAADPHTPRKEGDLRRNKLKQVLGLHAVIQWRQKYAAAQEDKQHINYTTPGTGPHYAENAVKEVVKNAGQYFKRAGL